MSGIRKIRPAHLALAAALLLAPAAKACEMCSIYTALEARESRPGLWAALSTQYTDFGTLSLDGVEVENEADESLDSTIHQVVVGYQLSERFGLQVNVPYIDRSFHRASGSGSETGLGDVALVAHWMPVERIQGEWNLRWGLLAGVEFGTGQSDLLAEEREEVEDHESGVKHGGEEHEEEESGIHPHDLALGSGSTDVLTGTTFHYGLRRLYVDAGFQYAFRRSGDFDYRFADETSWSVEPGGYLWLEHGRALSLSAVLAGEDKGRDEVAGVVLDDTARRTLYGGAALAYSHLDRFYGELEVAVPIDQESTALQIVPDLRLRLSMTARF